MSIHPSLKTRTGTDTGRNVLKRHERVRHMLEHGAWTDGRSAFGLPKIKQTKIKARKSAGKEKEAAEGQAAPGGEAAATPPAK